MGMAKPRAFILLGGLGVIARNWRYLTELDRQGLAILTLTAEKWRDAAQELATGQRQLSAPVAEVGFVGDGSLEIEGLNSGVVEKVREWETRYEIAGAFAAGEMLVEQAGIIADALGVPTPGLRATRVCRSKYLQRLYLAQWSPGAVIIPPSGRGSADVSGLKFPAVLKPSARCASSGVHQLADRDSLPGALAGYPEQETLLVEEYIAGPEFSVETLMQRGQPIFEGVTQKRTNEYGSDRFVEVGHTVPAPPGEERSALLAANRAILSRLGFSDGVAHAELRLSSSGEVRLMEVAARTPGDGILPLYQLATGQPMEPAILRIALGEAAAYPPPRRLARQVYLEHDVGTLVDVQVSWPGAEPVWVGEAQPWPEVSPGQPGDPGALRAVLVFARRGSRLRPLRESDDRAVSFLIDAPSLAELDELESQVRRSISIVVDPASAP
jgi:hypothetical protein